MPKKSFDILIRYQLVMRLLRLGKSDRQKVEYISLTIKIVAGHREIQSDHILLMLICELESFHNFIRINNRRTTQMFLVPKHHLVLMVSFPLHMLWFKAQEINIVILGLMAIMKNNQEPVTRIGDTWRPGGQVRPDEPAPRLLPPASPALSTSSSSDSSIGD